MITIPKQAATSWSFSRFSDYQTCPAKFGYKHVAKLKEPGSPAMERGTAIHGLAEGFVKGEIKRLPAELKLFKDNFAALKKEKVKFVEEQWTFRKDWSETAWNDWNGAWLRVKLDVAYLNTEHNVLVPIDHKTGKYREDKNAEYELQLELYGLASLKKFPHIDAVSPRLWYLDAGVVHPDPNEREILFERKDEKYLEKIWAGRIKKMMADTSFKPTPGAGCRFCHFRKENGGPCKF